MDQKSEALLVVLGMRAKKVLTSPKSRGLGCQEKTIVSFLEMLLRKRRRLHLLCTGMFPRDM